jgi:Tol biopolymer transport system component
MTRVRGALGLAAAALLALPPPAAPTPPGRNGIAFAVYGSGIAVVRPDGRGLRKLTKGRRDHFPAWSPDGRRLAFQRAGDIYVIHADGSGLVRLTQGRAADGQPAWSPDGRLIAFIRGGDLWLMQPDGSRPRALYVAGRANGPSWSPDGLRIAVGLATDGDRGSIVVIARSGGNVRYITDGRFEPDGDAPSEEQADDQQPDWSPNGTLIAFTRKVWLCPRCDQSAVFSARPNGLDVRWVTTDTSYTASGPSWSPDGTRFVATTNEGVALFAADGTRVRNLATQGTEPALQPLPRRGPGPAER